MSSAHLKHRRFEEIEKHEPKSAIHLSRSSPPFSAGSTGVHCFCRPAFLPNELERLHASWEEFAIACIPLKHGNIGHFSLIATGPAPRSKAPPWNALSSRLYLASGSDSPSAGPQNRRRSVQDIGLLGRAWAVRQIAVLNFFCTFDQGISIPQLI